MRPLALVAALALAAAGLTACGGESKQDKAKSQVCSARDDISKQVNTLKGLTVSTATTSQISSGLQAISEDLSKIKDAQGDLNAERKQQVQAANQQFEAQVRSIAQNVVKNLSLKDAGTQLTQATTQLADSYRQTLAKVDCG